MGTTTNRRRPGDAAAASPPVDRSPESTGDRTPEPAEVLIREARRRQHRRWAFSCLALALVGGLLAALLASGSGSPPPRSHSRTHNNAPTPHGQVAASPSISSSFSGVPLVGGEPIHVSVSGFPSDVAVYVSECPSARDIGPIGCRAGVIVVTDATGSATGVLVAQPLAQSHTGTKVRCRTQCVLAAVESTKFVKPRSGKPVVATSALTFTASGAGGLGDASLIDLSAASPKDVWALGERPCSTGTCAVVARSVDGGTTWQELPAPGAFVQSPTTNCTTMRCVAGITMANPSVGYLFGQALFMTTDGGEHWQVVPGPQTESLAVGAGQVFRVVYDHSGCPGPCAPVLQAAPVGSTSWHTVLGNLGYGVGSTVIVSGQDVYVVTYGNLASGAGSQRATISRSLDGGASFEVLGDPCVGAFSSLHVLSTLVAAPGGFLAADCSPRASPGLTYLITSSDSGATWSTPMQLPGHQLAAASQTTLVAIGRGATGKESALYSSIDGGRQSVVAATRSGTTPSESAATPGGSTVASPWFATSKAGWWITSPHSIEVTLDGGTSWSRIAFR